MGSEVGFLRITSLKGTPSLPGILRRRLTKIGFQSSYLVESLYVVGFAISTIVLDFRVNSAWDFRLCSSVVASAMGNAVF